VLDLVLPPLRERAGDAVFLAEEFLKEEEKGRGPLAFSPEALRAIESAEWRGNIRELQNKVRKGAVRAKGTVRPQDMGPSVRGVAKSEKLMDEAQRLAVEKALRESGGKISKAAEILGIDRATLRKRLKKLGLYESETGD